MELLEEGIRRLRRNLSLDLLKNAHKRWTGARIEQTVRIASELPLQKSIKELYYSRLWNEHEEFWCQLQNSDQNILEVVSYFWRWTQIWANSAFKKNQLDLEISWWKIWNAILTLQGSNCYVVQELLSLLSRNKR